MYSHAWLCSVGAGDLNSDLAFTEVLFSPEFAPQH